MEDYVHDKEYFVGIDPSLSASGLVMINEQGEIVVEKLIKTFTEHYICIEQRLLDIMESITFLSGVLKLNCVYVEELPYLSKGGAIFERAGLMYMITSFLFSKDIAYSLIKPTTLKKWAVGKGNADKKMMMELSGERWGINFTDDNICDAYNLAQMCRHTEGDVKE